MDSKNTSSENSGAAASSNIFALISLLLGILSVPCCLLPLYTLPIPVLAIVFAVIQRVRAKEFTCMGITGLICGSISIMLSIIFIAVLISFINSPELQSELEAFAVKHGLAPS